MAAPTDPLIVWATDDVVLPVSGQQNKIRPQDSLISTGWDQTQKPSAEEFNYILNNLAQWIEYYGVEHISDILSDYYTKTETYSKTEINAKTISAGVGLSGGGDLSDNRTISMATPSTIGNGSTNSATNSGSPTHSHALTLTASNISILTGTIAHGGTIPLPAGYIDTQCYWTISFNSQVTALSTAGADDRNYLRLFTTGRVVSCYISQPNNPATLKEAGVANYIIIGIK